MKVTKWVSPKNARKQIEEFMRNPPTYEHDSCKWLYDKVETLYKSHPMYNPEL